MQNHSTSETPGGTTSERWPKRFLVFTIDNYTQNVSAHSQIVIVHEDAGYEDAQAFAEAYFEDHSVMRIYELRQMFAIGKFRGQ